MPVPESIRIASRPAAHESQVDCDASSASGRSITLRAVLIGLVLMAADAFWITVVEVRWYTLDGTSLPLFITPVFFLFCLTVTNLAIRRIKPRWALDQGELLAIYIMLVAGAAL